MKVEGKVAEQKYNLQQKLSHRFTCEYLVKKKTNKQRTLFHQCNHCSSYDIKSTEVFPSLQILISFQIGNSYTLLHVWYELLHGHRIHLEPNKH